MAEQVRSIPRIGSPLSIDEPIMEENSDLRQKVVKKSKPRPLSPEKFYELQKLHEMKKDFKI